MKSSTLSLRRRHLLIAGLAGAAMPGALFANQCVARAPDPSAPPTVSEVSSKPSGDKLIVSGRVVGTDCRPLFGARVEAWHEGASGPRSSVTTDADGRFMLETATGARGRALKIRVSHGQLRLVQQHDYMRQPGIPDEFAARLHRDDTGIWRTSLGLTLA